MILVPRSAWGHERRFGRTSLLSGLPPTADIGTSSRFGRRGRVEDGRRSLGPMANAPFPIPAHQTGRADFRSVDPSAIVPPTKRPRTRCEDPEPPAAGMRIMGGSEEPATA